VETLIDLRSDTVTRPTDEMRAAMAQAEVGDDVYKEDPTVNELEARAARMLGMQASLFVPSGTMGNLIAVLAHCGRGAEVIVGDRSHTYINEAGGVSVLGGVHTMAVPNQADGSIALEALRAAIRPDDIHYPVTRLVCLENTHNACGGTVLTEAYTRAVAELVHVRDIRLHIDGARIFNAAVALGVPAASLAAPADSITFCLSKGLSAPVGSMLCGDVDFIEKSLRLRKLLGGGMRQAGILAAAGLVALETMIDRIAEDHARTRSLAEMIASLPGLDLDPPDPPTNMLFFRIRDDSPVEGEALIAQLRGRNVLASPSRSGRFRLVLHADIGDAALAHVVKSFQDIFQVAA
jgi:threonine aldolase